MAAAVAGLKGSALSLRQRPARHIAKVALRSTPIMHLMILNKTSQSIEQDCEHLQCLMSIYKRLNVSDSADSFLKLGY